MHQKVLFLIGYTVTTKLIGYVVSSGYKPNWALTNKGWGKCQSKSGHVSLKLQNSAYESSFFHISTYCISQSKYCCICTRVSPPSPYPAQQLLFF